MKVNITYNEQKHGIEVRFSEKPTREQLDEIDFGKMGFRFSKYQQMWYAKKTPTRDEFVQQVKKQLESDSFTPLDIFPSYSPSEENIKHRNFSYVSISIKGLDGKITFHKYIVFEPSKKLATEIVTKFGQKTYGKDFIDVNVYPKNYVREARSLLKAGNIITTSTLGTKKEIVQASNPKEKIGLKEIYLTIESTNRRGEFDKGKKFKSFKAAHQYIVELLGQVSDVYYKVVWKDDEELVGYVDLEPSTFFDHDPSILSNWISNYFQNVSKESPDAIVSQENIDDAKHLLNKYQLEDAVEVLKDSLEGIDIPPLDKKLKLDILNEFSQFYNKRKEEFPAVDIEDFEIPIMFKGWLGQNHPLYRDNWETIYQEVEEVQKKLFRSTQETTIDKKDYRLFFVRFREQQQSEIGEVTGASSLDTFEEWLDANYSEITALDRKGLLDYYATYVKSIKASEKKLAKLSEPKKEQPYSSNFNKLNKVIPNLKQNLEKGSTYGKSSFEEESGHMGLSLDVIGKDTDNRYEVALSHTYQENGDLIPDPDMQLRIDFDLETVEALTYQDSIGYQQVYHQENDKVYFNNKLKKDLNKFLSQWLTNLIQQGHKIVWESKQKESSQKEITGHDLNQSIEKFIIEKDKENHVYTPEEKRYIKGYTGAGGLAHQGAAGNGLLYEYYTPEAIVKIMWGLAYKYGYTGGAVLEPSCGIGNFLQYVPKNTKAIAYEINPISKRIAEILNPTVKIHSAPFESIFYNGNIHLKDEFDTSQLFNLVIGNPPFGTFSGKYAGMGEKTWTKAKMYEEYFITRGLDLLYPGGLLIYIIPSGFLKGVSSKVKERIASKVESIVDAYQLPSGVFSTTDYGTDIIVLKKKSELKVN